LRRWSTHICRYILDYLEYFVQIHWVALKIISMQAKLILLPSRDQSRP
jgi:hypothetical protein